MYSFKACVNNPNNNNDVILLHEESHGIVITLRCFKQVLIYENIYTHTANPAMQLQGTQTRGASHLLRRPACKMYRMCAVLAHETSIHDIARQPITAT